MVKQPIKKREKRPIPSILVLIHGEHCLIVQVTHHEVNPSHGKNKRNEHKNKVKFDQKNASSHQC
jgi:hypothetical protein